MRISKVIKRVVTIQLWRIGISFAIFALLVILAINQQIIWLAVIVFLLDLILLSFGIILISNTADKYLNNFWKNILIYNFKYKGKDQSLFFGILYLIIAVAMLIGLSTMILTI